MRASPCVVALVVVVMLCIPLVPSPRAQYVGSEFCLSCHSGFAPDKTSWRETKHNRAIRDPDQGMGVVPHSDFQSGLDLNGDPDFSALVPNAPVLGYIPPDMQDTTDFDSGYRVSFGGIDYHVNATYGGTGDWKQRFMTQVGQSYYILPIQYNEATLDWVTYHTDNWYDVNTPLYQDSLTIEEEIDKPDAFERRCIGCHSTGLKVFWDAAGDSAYTSSYSELNTGCERCHGAYNGNHANLIAPEDLITDRSNEICGSCHNRGVSTAQVGGHTFGFPWDSPDSLGGFLPGDSLGAFFVMVDPLTDPDRFWPDSTSESHRQQFIDFYHSPKPTFEFHEVRCYECHDVHGTANPHDIVEEIIQIEDPDTFYIATENDNNTLCLACHATHGAFEALTQQMIEEYAANIDTVAAVVTAHTRHSWDPEDTLSTGGASRCSKCHMPKVIRSAVEYDIHSHTFHVLRPEDTIGYVGEPNGNPNACAVSCHRNATGAIPDFGIGTDADIGDWTEATDIALAETLVVYYGPGGQWWTTLVSGGWGERIEMPSRLSLAQSYPNPMYGSTTINYSVPASGAEHLTLRLYNLTGQLVRTLAEGPHEPGRYEVRWDGRDGRGSRVASGLYFYRIEADGVSVNRKMVVMR